MKLFLLKKKLGQILELQARILLLVAYKTLNFFTTKRTIMFVSNEKIRCINLGPTPQILLIIVFCWLGNMVYHLVNHERIIVEKTTEIERLRAANKYFSEEFEDLNDKVNKIDSYFSAISGDVKKVNGSGLNKESLVKPKVDENDPILGKDLQTLNNIRNSNLKVASVSESISMRIETIESALMETGLGIKKSNFSKFSKKTKLGFFKQKNGDAQNKNSAIGGPIESHTELDSSLLKKFKKYTSFNHSNDLVLNLSNNLDRLISLEKIVAALPLNIPIRNFYISSGFGVRKDPLTRRYHPHQGLDFVGPNGAKIISPASGRVVLAEWFSDYGNAVVIDHGNGITTRYGHLSKINVSEGQRVKDGDVIAIQGNTGRSTGSHLHYEIRYQNRPLDPKNFIKAGNKIKNRKQIYVNS